jgi:hypothetical protein
MIRVARLAFYQGANAITDRLYQSAESGGVSEEVGAALFGELNGESQKELLNALQEFLKGRE